MPKRTRSRIPLLLLALLLVGVMVGLWARSGSAQAPTERFTLPFSHKTHVQEVGVDCLFCHSQGLRSPQAGLPALETCMVCHEVVSGEDEEAQAEISLLRQAVEQGTRVAWPDVYRQPDFVYFSHRPHLAEGVACQACHGPVEQMDLVERRVDMDMGFCLDCHRQEEDVADRARLLDCATCHQ